jgi:hypothetical protein
MKLNLSLIDYFQIKYKHSEIQTKQEHHYKMRINSVGMNLQD